MAETLIRATVEMLAELGPQNITAPQVAARAGVSTNRIFQYFHDMDTLIAYAMQRIRQSRRAKRAPARVPPPIPPRGFTPPQQQPRAGRFVPPPPPGKAPPPPAPPPRRASPSPERPPPPPEKPAPPRRRAGSVRPSVNPFASGGANPFASTPGSEPAAKPFVKARPKPPSSRRLREPATIVLRETPEQTFEPAARQLVEQFAAELPEFAQQSKEDQKGLYKMAFATMAKAIKQALALYRVPAPGQVSHLLTLSCHRVVQDALARNPETFHDGRLVQSLCRLCAEFLASEG